MNRINICFFLLLTWNAVLVFAASPRPNIVILMADDMGYADPGCFGGIAQTPRIDQLAKEGLRFTDFYAGAPVCSPSRAAMLTGRTPTRIGVYDYLAPNAPMCLPKSEVTIAELLQGNGYRTGHFGKWHLAAGNLESPNPNEQGYDYWFASANNAIPSHLNPNNFYRNGNCVGRLEGYACDLVVMEAIDWLKQSNTETKPFFATIWFNEPHIKLASPPELVEKYVQKGYSQEESLYLANIENIDTATGKFLDALDTLGFRDNTLVLFTSDNGSQLYARSVGALRGKKQWIYEGGIRVPTIIRWSKHIKSGTETSVPAGFVDILPTFCVLSGTELPKDRFLDGTDFTPLFEGNEFVREKPLFWFYYKSNPICAIRDGNFKLCARTEPRQPSKSHAFDMTDQEFLKSAMLVSFELYDIKNDAGEKKDIAKHIETKMSKKLEQFKEKLLKIHAEVIAEGITWEGLPKE
jgi:arylsulfatase A